MNRRDSAAALLAVGLAGCGGSKGLVPVEGRVTFGGGNPPGARYLFFVTREMSTNLKKDTAGFLRQVPNLPHAHR